MGKKKHLSFPLICFWLSENINERKKIYINEKDFHMYCLFVYHEKLSLYFLHKKIERKYENKKIKRNKIIKIKNNNKKLILDTSSNLFHVI